MLWQNLVFRKMIVYNINNSSISPNVTHSAINLWLLSSSVKHTESSFVNLSLKYNCWFPLLLLSFCWVFAAELVFCITCYSFGFGSSDRLKLGAMARGQQKIQSQQKNAKKAAEKKKAQGADQKTAAKAALVHTCPVCRVSARDKCTPTKNPIYKHAHLQWIPPYNYSLQF